MPNDVTLYGPDNRPIKKQDLTREYAAPTLAGIRTLWNETVASGLTPERLARLLRDADEGEMRAYLTLAEEMEEREPHYASVLGTRKRAVTRLPATVEAASDDAQDVKMADAVRELIRRGGFKALLEDLLDSLGKGFSCTEIMWDRGDFWWPRYEWRDPRFFTFDRIRRSEIRLLDEADLVNGIPLPAYKFITHRPRLKSGIPIRGGLARLVAWSYMAKMYDFKDWLAFVEVFGMPLRIGRYNAQSATDRDIAILKTAVANLGSDAAAVLPDSMKIEFQEAAKATGGNTLFLMLANWIDKQISKAVLGQTMTADDGSSQAQAKVHDEVRSDIRDADAEQLEETLNRDLVRPFIDLNFGPQKVYPTLQLQIAKQEDIATLASALEKLVPLGLRVEQSVIRDKIGIPDPDPKAKPEDLLGDPAAPAPGTAANRHQHFSCSCCGDHGIALNRAGKGGLDAADVVAARLAQEAAPITDAMIEQVRQLVESASSLQEIKDKLFDLYGDMDPEALGTLMMEGMMTGHLAGRGEVIDGD